MKKSIIFAGAAALSLSTVICAAGETAPANAPGSANANANTPTQVVEEESVTVVAAVPAAPGACTAGNAKCAPKKCVPAAKNCPSGDKTCADGKSCKKAACAPDKEYSDDDFAVAYELMELCNEPQNIENANALLIEAQMQQVPMLSPARPAFQHFFKKHCSYEAMKKDLAKIHLGVFTRDELKKIIDFFKTPEGKKLAASHTELMQKSMELREKRIHDNLPELQQNVQTAMESCMKPCETPVAQTQPPTPPQN